MVTPVRDTQRRDRIVADLDSAWRTPSRSRSVRQVAGG